jgi:hypothetical protein
MAGNVILVYASPLAVGFYARLGAIKIGATPFVLSPDVQLSNVRVFDSATRRKQHRRVGRATTHLRYPHHSPHVA